MKQHNLKTQFVVCVKNKDYPASLELRKIYQVIPDARAAEHRLIRVIDELGKDYLYPAECFVPIELPQAAEKTFCAGNLTLGCAGGAFGLKVHNFPG